MAYSDTISGTVFTTRKVIENAVRRCRIPAEQITAEYVDIARDQLYLWLMDLSNQGYPLWCVEKQIYPLYNGRSAITMTAGTVDILNFNLRTLQLVPGTDVQVAAAITRDFGASQVISTLGILWDGASTDVTILTSDDGIVWVEQPVACQSAGPVGAGQWIWYDLEAAVTTRYARIEADVGNLNLATLVTSGLPSEIPLYRMNKDDYTNLPNKTFLSNRPTQFWFDRQIPNPIMRLWPTPNAQAEENQIVLWRHRQIMDVGTLNQQLELPQRWYRAAVSNLAAMLVREIIEADPALIPQLDRDAAIDLNVAQTEERDNSTITWAPNIGMYTR